MKEELNCYVSFLVHRIFLVSAGNSRTAFVQLKNFTLILPDFAVNTHLFHFIFDVFFHSPS